MAINARFAGKNGLAIKLLDAIFAAL